MVQQQVQFDGAAFDRPPVFRPVEHAHRQVDDAPVQTQQLVFETELLPSALALHQFLAFEQRLLEHRLVQLPWPMLIGVGQRDLFGATGTPRCFSCPSQQASPPQISRNECARPNWQNSIAMNWPQLVNPRACRSALCFLDRLLEISPRKQLQHLRENAAYSPAPGRAQANAMLGGLGRSCKEFREDAFGHLIWVYRYVVGVEVDNPYSSMHVLPEFCLRCFPNYLVHTWGFPAVVFRHSSNGQNLAAVRVGQQTL
jgi:hypothetical protein